MRRRKTRDEKNPGQSSLDISMSIELRPLRPAFHLFSIELSQSSCVLFFPSALRAPAGPPGRESGVRKNVFRKYKIFRFMTFFLIAAAVAALVIFLYMRCLRSTAMVLTCSLIAVICFFAAGALASRVVLPLFLP